MLEDRDVERAAAEVEHADQLIAVAAEAVRERGGGRLVDQAHDLEPGEPAGFLGRLCAGASVKFAGTVITASLDLPRRAGAPRSA